MTNKTIKTIGTVGIMAIIACGSYILGTTQTEPVTKIETVTEIKEVVPDGCIQLDECIPVDDIACHYTDDNGHICVQLKDVGNQLGSADNASYTDALNDIDDITDEYNSHMVDMDKVVYFEVIDGLQLYYEDGSGYYWE